MATQRPKSCKKGSGRPTLDDYEFSSSWTPFCLSNGLNLSKRGLAAVFPGLASDAFFLPTAGPLFDHSAVQFRQKGVAASFLNLLGLTFRFSAPAPLFGPSAARILQKGRGLPNLTLASHSLQQIPSLSVYVDVKPGSWEYMCYLPVCESMSTPDNPNTEG